MSSSSFEKAVRGGTKVKLAAPKSKYVEHILLATQSGEAGVAEVMRTLTHRLRDSTWTVAFKSLILVHMMIKEGARDVTLSYLAVAPSHRLAINTFTDVQTQGHNIRRYSEFLLSRAKAFEKSGIDYVRRGEARVRDLSVDKGLLRESEIVQEQIKACLKCNLLDTDENEISLTAFRLCTRDLLDLFSTLNAAVMKILGQYFELSRPDAERAISIYRRYCTQTEGVINYLRTAQTYQHALRLEIPKLKHAPVDLADTLQEYLDDKDFDIHRRQYLAQQEAKKSGKHLPKTNAPVKTQQSLPSAKASIAAPSAPAKQPGPPANLIDFFDSIEQNQQPLAVAPQANGFMAQPAQAYPQNGFVPQPAFAMPQQQQPMMLQQQQQTGFAPQYTGAVTSPVHYQQPAQVQNAFGQLMQTQAIQAQPTAAMLQPQSTNPFRKSMQPTGSIDSYGPMPTMPQHITPFGAPQQQAPAMQPFAPQQQTPLVTGYQPQQQMPQATDASQPFAPFQQPQQTGTNPFARSTASATPPVSTLQVQPTGSTNPFRQSAFVNQQTGSGWQNSQSGTMGGLEQLPTVPVFPRPGAQNPQTSSPWA